MPHWGAFLFAGQDNALANLRLKLKWVLQAADSSEESKIRVIVRKRPLNVRVGPVSKDTVSPHDAVDPVIHNHVSYLHKRVIPV